MGLFVNAYLHIPFCSSFCSYCDFTSFTGKESIRPAYVSSLCDEIGASDLSGPLKTVYVGGGTPSLLEPNELKRILDALRGRAGVREDAEVSMEANPESVDSARLTAFRKAGINRLSLGAQSSQGRLLSELSRCHDWSQVEKAARAAREAGIRDLSIDLMIGLPGQTVGMIRATLADTLALSPDHLSVYALQLEEGTPLAARVRGGLPLPDDDETADQYGEVQSGLRDAGFAQYEVSNWCRPGHECRHNLAVWQGEDYWGFGVSAAGTRGLVRRTNTQELDRYLVAAGRDEGVEIETLPLPVKAFERVMLMLRTSRGVPEEEVAALLERSAAGQRRYETYLSEGWVVREGGRVHPSPAGYLRLHGLLEALMP